MKIKYTKVKNPGIKNCYQIKFAYEHGDADSNSSNTIGLKNIDEEFLLKYVGKAELVAKMINDNRSYDVKLPKHFSESADLKMGKYFIPVELDDYAKMHSSDYYAAMEIEEILYFDENGEKFKVDIER